MKALIADLKEKINQVIENNLQLLDRIDHARSKAFESEDAYNHFSDLRDLYSKEEEKLLHLRSALVSVYQATGDFDVNVFYPEKHK